MFLWWIFSFIHCSSFTLPFSLCLSLFFSFLSFFFWSENNVLSEEEHKSLPLVYHEGMQNINLIEDIFPSFSQETVNVFLSWKNTDEPDLEGRTAFMWAAGKGADNVLRVFFHHDVDVQQEDKTGGTGKNLFFLP